MILFKSTFIFLILAFATTKVLAQANPYISVLPSNSGIVAVGATNDLLITVGNTLSGSIPVSKLRPVITLPASVAFLPDAQQTGLPVGWTILSNIGSQLRLCNSGDVIPGFTARDIILKVQGVTMNPPLTFSGQINFGNGTTCAAGTSVSGNNTADDFATSTIEVVAAPLPLTILSFNATLINCQPTLNWITEFEINSDRFAIERNEIGNTNADWKTVGEVTAGGTLTKSTYKFTDVNINATMARVFYRLKIIDKDGSYKYSNVLPVFINCKNLQVHIYPNPVQKGRLFMSLTGATVKTVATLIAASGQVVSTSPIFNGTNYINTSGFADGMYILHIKDANAINKQVKVFIQNH